MTADIFAVLVALILLGYCVYVIASDIKQGGFVPNKFVPNENMTKVGDLESTIFSGFVFCFVGLMVFSPIILLGIDSFGFIKSGVWDPISLRELISSIGSDDFVMSSKYLGLNKIMNWFLDLSAYVFFILLDILIVIASRVLE